MKLTEFEQKLREFNSILNNPKVFGSLNYSDFNTYQFIHTFCTYTYANRLIGYFTLSKNEGFKTLFSLHYEIKQQCFLYQYYPNLTLISPQPNKLKRNDNPQLKALEIIYNKKNNSLILF